MTEPIAQYPHTAKSSPRLKTYRTILYHILSLLVDAFTLLLLDWKDRHERAKLPGPTDGWPKTGESVNRP